MGHYRAAAGHYAKAAELSPDDAEVLNSQGWLKATSPESALRNGREAIRLSTRACELRRWRDADTLDTLAAAEAEAGNFEEAVK